LLVETFKLALRFVCVDFETKIINMEKTVLNQLLEWCKEFDDKNYHPTHTNMKEKIWQLLPKEKEQMCKMYVQGRNDNHLDYYPEKHAKETYDEFFVRREQNDC